MSALLLWILSALLSQSGQNARLGEQLTSVQVQLAGLYRAEDARRDMAEVARDMARLSERIDRLDSRLDVVEKTTGAAAVTTPARAR